MFPLKERSNFNYTAPILEGIDIEYIKGSLKMKSNMHLSASIITDFWGMGKDNDKIKYVVKNDRLNLWITPMNHNFLRVSRVLKSLVLFDLKNEAELLFKCLKEIRNDGKERIIGESFLYWEKAIE
jgi:hypothetical protein